MQMKAQDSNPAICYLMEESGGQPAGMLCEIRQTLKDKQCMTSLTFGI
jgi:hypothetical protein